MDDPMKKVDGAYGRTIVVNNLVSVNAMYANSRKGRRLTPRARAAKESIALQAIAGYGHNPIKGEVAVSIRYYFSDRRQRDVTNFDKLILDALKGIFYEDDSDIVCFIASKFYDPVNAQRAVVEVFDIRNLIQFQGFEESCCKHLDWHSDHDFTFMQPDKVIDKACT